MGLVKPDALAKVRAQLPIPIDMPPRHSGAPMQYYESELSPFLRWLYRLFDVTQGEFAKTLGVSRATLSRSHQHEAASEEFLFTLAQHLRRVLEVDVTSDELFDLTMKPRTDKSQSTKAKWYRIAERIRLQLVESK